MKEIQYGPLRLQADDANTCYTVVSCDKAALSAEIPAEISGLPVCGIGDRAFEGCGRLAAVRFSPKLERDPQETGEEFFVGDAAFATCTALKEITLPTGVTFVGWGAFRDCTALERVRMPDCLCAPYTFCRCGKLVEISPMTDAVEGMFSHCASLATFPLTADSCVIGEDAFEHCDALTAITVPAAVKEIGQLAFRDCARLASVLFEHTEGWYWHCTYDDAEHPLDVSDPVANARRLSRADFDDGVTRWFRK